MSSSGDSDKNDNNNDGVDDQDDTTANEAEATALKLKDQGNEQLKIGHFLQAIGFYSDALEHSPTNHIILSNRAQAYIKVESYGLAMSDATSALKSDPNYAKAYYRRGSAQFALGHLKDARKDFRKVCQLNPKSKDARAKLKACEKSIRQDLFLKAIESEKTAPLSATYDPNSIVISPDSYDGPNPIVSGPTDDMELETSQFEPGKLPREFVLVSIFSILHALKKIVYWILTSCNNCVNSELYLTFYFLFLTDLYFCGIFFFRLRWIILKIKNSSINDTLPDFYLAAESILNL
jgi:tetratricopeptide (TPR) repeat protein